MLHIYKAQATGGEAVDDVQISIQEPIPRMCSLDAATGTFSKDAEALEAALYRSLPGGTYDRLLGKMLERKATHFVVSHQG